jgi:hypothetical protein
MCPAPPDFRLAESGIDRGRIVVVGAGFGLWLGGRCLATGRWSDIASIRAYRKGAGDERTYLAVRLGDGSEVEMASEAPGWIEFASVAPTKLPGMTPAQEWLPELPDATQPMHERILFERANTIGHRRE